jgi:hypothetical protein
MNPSLNLLETLVSLHCPAVNPFELKKLLPLELYYKPLNGFKLSLHIFLSNLVTAREPRKEKYKTISFSLYESWKTHNGTKSHQSSEQNR